MYYFITGSEPFRHREDPRERSEYGLKKEIRKNRAIPFFPDNVSPQLRNLLERCWDNNHYRKPSASEIYYHLTSEKEYLIDGIDLQKDLPEIERYIDMIEEFNLNEKYENKLNIQENFCFEFYSDTDELIPTDPAKQKQKLSYIISTNFSASFEKEIIPLLFAMEENGSLYEDNDSLPQIINLINDFCSRGNKKAKRFIKKVFGDYIVSKSVTEIKENTINNKVEKVNIPPWVTKIGKRAFCRFANLLRVNIPNSVKVIEEEAFLECKQLKHVNLPESLEANSIGKGAFVSCTSLRYVKIPSKITIINDFTFECDTELSTVVFGECLEIIGRSAFRQCRSLRSIELPKTVVLISSRAFSDCDNLWFIKLHGPENKIKFEKSAIGRYAEKIMMS